MKKIFSSLLIICLSLQLSAQTIDWALNSTNENAAYPAAIAVDKEDNLYGVATFTGTISIDTKSITGTSTTSDGLIVKFEKNSKTPIWIKGILGSGANKVTAKSIAMDSEGNIYVVGEFETSVTIDGTTLTSDYADIYLFKLSPAGTVLTAKSFGFGAAPGISNVAVDKNDDVYITGNFEEIINFGAEANAIENAGNNMYLAKFDKNLNYQWTSYGEGAAAFTAGKMISFDDSNVYLVGSLVGVVNFAGYSTAIASRPDAISNGFVSKFSKADGSCIWAKSFGGTGTSKGATTDELLGIKVKNGKIGLIGAIRSLSATMDGINTVFNHQNQKATTASNVFLLILTTDGEYTTHAVIGDATANNNAIGFSIDIDNSGNAYICGDISGTSSIGTIAAPGFGGRDNLFGKFNISGGEFTLGCRNGSDETESLKSLALNKDENILYAHGGFIKRTGTKIGNPNVTLTISDSPYILPFGGAGTQIKDCPFWAKYNLSIINKISDNTLVNNLFYNSANKSIELNLSDDLLSISLVDMAGKTIDLHNSNCKKQSIPVTNVEKGIYIVIVKTQFVSITRKIVIE